VFDGLFPEPHNTAVLNLIFICAHWHGMAKLRMHTDDTLRIFDDLTVHIGAEFRSFNEKTCPAFKTHELRRETEARKRRRSKKHGTTGVSTSSRLEEQSEADGPLPKMLNIQTYKHHSLGDYPKAI
jgi:hypothetical protein